MKFLLTFLLFLSPLSSIYGTDENRTDLAYANPASAPASHRAEIAEVTSENFEAEVLNSSIPVIVDFYADWCSHCKGMHKNLQNLSAKYAGKIKIVKLNVDKSRNLAISYQIKDLPAVFFIKNGQIADKQIGSADKSVIEQKLNNLLL